MIHGGSGRIAVLIPVFIGLLLSATSLLLAQDAKPPTPTLRAGALTDAVHIDGAVTEDVWAAAPMIDAFTQTDPVEGAAPSARTVVRVLVSPKALVFGIVCEDPDAAHIVSFSVRRDAQLNSEDHVRIVLGPFLDGRSGYVFAVNPSGARYDALIAPGGENETPDWDGIWEAATRRGPDGWSAEISIPIQTLSFKPGQPEWDFNVQRRIQRLLETTRWAFPQRQYKVTQTSRAGRLTGLPEFSLGRGLSVRPAITSGGGVPAPGAPVQGEFQPSLDVTQRLGSNLLSSLTVNTDFAETEVDTRRTNLTRFPLFFPEKRTFFLEGADLFTFGLGLGQDVIPFFSRRIGLVGGSTVPLIAGGKISGRAANTSIGSLVAGTGSEPGVVEDAALMAVGRVKQNVGDESWVGAIATVGDPTGRAGSWLGGADFTYATSLFRGNRNLLVGAWGLATGREGLGHDATAAGFSVSYPNDKWDMGMTGKRIGSDFDPSLGFVPRRSVFLYSGNINNHQRLANGPLQQVTFEFEPTLATDLSGLWESYRVFTAPLNWRFRSGERLEFNVVPTGERLDAPFEVADGVTIAPGTYNWMRYRLEAGTAQKRRLFAQVSWWLGGFYDGTLDQIQLTTTWNPTPLLTVEFAGSRDIGRLPEGPFNVTVVGTRLRVNVSPDLSLSSYVQYDTNSDSIGVNTRLRWTFRPVADLFVVYNHNIRSIEDRWQQQSNQLIVKLQYAWRW